MQRPAHVYDCVCGWGGIELLVIKHSSSSASFPCQPACLGIEWISVCLLQRLHSFNWSLLIDGRWVVTYCSLLWPVAVWGYSQLWVDILSVTEAVCVFLGMPETPNYPLSPRIVVFGTYCKCHCLCCMRCMCLMHCPYTDVLLSFSSMSSFILLFVIHPQPSFKHPNRVGWNGHIICRSIRHKHHIVSHHQLWRNAHKSSKEIPIFWPHEDVNNVDSVTVWCYNMK